MTLKCGAVIRSLVSMVVLFTTTLPASAQVDSSRVEAVAGLLEELIETYGVSGDEQRVRAVVERHLPAWAKPRVDESGNLWVRAGQGDPVVVFIAHMDEVGFQVTELLDDGSLQIRQRGGFYPHLWEATPAFVHTAETRVPGIFMPRDEHQVTPTRRPPAGFRVSVGMSSRAATEALGVRIGNTVTNPKEFVRLAGTRATARSFDDRAGSTAQLVALQSLDLNALDHEVIFIWSTEEEVGLVGATAVADELGFTPARVHAVDTFVSSAAPVDRQNFAFTPLGQGPVARGLDSSSVTPRAIIDGLLELADGHNLPLQLGATNGGTDGTGFRDWGIPHMPIGWPLRYSHSPIELIDLRDLVVLSDLIQLIAEEW